VSLIRERERESRDHLERERQKSGERESKKDC